MMTLSLVLAAALQAPAAPADAWIGRWNVKITDVDNTFGGAWFQLGKKDGAATGSVVWRWGSVVPALDVRADGGTVRFAVAAEDKSRDAYEVRIQGSSLKGEVKHADGTMHHFEGRRAPELAATAAPQWGEPIKPFDGKSLEGWALRDPKAKMGWAAVDGELQVVEPKGNADLVTAAAFQDMKLHLEFNVEPHSNSGVYLRGRYEIQILDDKSKATEEHGCGALYSRIAPSVDATKAAGEWQTFDITFVGRKLTVVLNGKTILDAVTVEGITGGAINPYEDEPGPLMLQGDHGKVRFRNIVVTPAR
jgi:3-keto-disaccharide hydrolase